ncbi:sigma-54 dependent transcriptional regulator, partial [Myxococcota bacterium]|nr:sigma-54 dependent transcriptional regulator [Myxococcota bacterium]MBU1533675.1 sigma-54 dependent transcriptional regulator [Myxococcota bacterium]
MDSTKSRILFVEDDKSGRELGVFNLTKAGYTVDEAASGEEALIKFSPLKHRVVITDLKMPGISGMELLARIHAEHPQIPVIVITAYGNIDVAVTAMKEGAYDFITKPFNKDQLIFTIGRALERAALAREVQELKIRATGIERPIIFQSAIMGRQIAACEKFAASDASVLITGESGTGKELFARLLHVRSARAQKPFVAINCAAIPENLLESELFGHARGAFTGAHQARTGKFRQAQGGTIFLDEISEIPTSLQSKILRAIQEREVVGVGEDKPRSIDVRFVSATNRDLQRQIIEGTFRED